MIWFDKIKDFIILLIFLLIAIYLESYFMHLAGVDYSDIPLYGYF